MPAAIRPIHVRAAVRCPRCAVWQVAWLVRDDASWYLRCRICAGLVRWAAWAPGQARPLQTRSNRGEPA